MSSKINLSTTATPISVKLAPKPVANTLAARLAAITAKK